MDAHTLQRYLLWWLGMDVNWKIFKWLQKREDWLQGEIIGKTTILIQITQASKLIEQPIPKWCKEFMDVFSEKIHETLPPHCPYNHTIDLKDTFSLKIAKVYFLNLAKMDTCKAFIKEHLKMGCIVPSKSPQASPFFFVPKKDGSLQPC